ncbi:hypothetical protein [Nonomuraea basaltis]|uniref:hypothetical protein n=1 Tax=Nonomuraea basaltis TaxID=2495887 RepID=UPI00197F1CC3|nr:hypothetical protein [Nonomuraea basaltis]
MSDMRYRRLGRDGPLVSVVGVGGLAALPQVGSVICGAMTPQQVTANAAAAGWTPDAADVAALDHIVPPGERVV